MSIKIMVFAMSISVISCIPKRNTSNIASTSQNPINYNDDACYQTVRATNDADSSGPVIAPGPVCPNEIKALSEYYDLGSSSFFDDYQAFREKVLDWRGTLAEDLKEVLRSQSDKSTTIPKYSEEHKKIVKAILLQIDDYINTFKELERETSLTKGECKEYYNAIGDGENLEKNCQRSITVSNIEFLMAGDCVNNYPPEVNANYASGYCHLIKLSKKFEIMADFRSTDPEDGSYSPLGSVEIYRRMSREIKREIGIKLAELSAIREEVAAGIYDISSPITVPYPSIVARPEFFMEMLSSSFADWTVQMDSFELNMRGEVEISSNENAVKQAILGFSKENSRVSVDNKISEKQLANIDADIANKVKISSRIQNENASALRRISTEFDAVIGNELANFVDKKTKILASKSNPNANGQYILSSDDSITEEIFEEAKSLPLVLRVTAQQRPNIVANGVLVNSIETLEKNIDYLDGERHWKYSGEGQRSGRWGKGRSKKWVIGAPPTDVFARDYKDEPNVSVQQTTRVLRDVLSNVASSHYGAYTESFDGYISSKGFSSGTGQGSSKGPKPSFGSSIVPAVAGAIATYYGGPIAGAAAAGLAAELFSANADRTSNSSGTSQSRSSNWREGVYHGLAKYPDIRVGQLVAELGCGGAFPEYVGPELDQFGRLVKAPRITLPVSFSESKSNGGDEEDVASFISYFRKPAGNNSLITFGSLPKNRVCEDPKVRFIINDYPIGANVTSDCIGRCKKESDGKCHDDVQIPNFVPAPTACTYADSAFTLVVTQISSTKQEYQRGLEILANEGILDPTNPGENYRDLAYSADPTSEIELAFYQKMTKANIAPDVKRLLRPLARHFATYLLNERTMEEINHSVAQLQIERDKVQFTQTRLESETKYLNKMLTLEQENLNWSELYRGSLKQRQLIYQNAARYHVSKMREWFYYLEKSIEYHQYQSVKTLKEFQANIDSVLDEIEQMSLKEYNKLPDKAGLSVQYANLKTKLGIGLKEEKVKQLFRREIFTADVGHCIVPLGEIYPNEFNSGEMAYNRDDTRLDKMRKSRREKFLVGSSEKLFIDGYKRRFTGEFFAIPIDTTNIPQMNFDQKNKVSCSHNFIVGDRVPKVLGYAVEVIGAGQEFYQDLGSELFMTRSDIMGWAPILDIDDPTLPTSRFSRIIDYSMLDTSFLRGVFEGEQSIPRIRYHHSSNVRNKSGCHASYVPQIDEDCATHLMGSNALLAGSELVLEHKANFRVNEFNIYLGNLWTLVIPQSTHSVIMDKATNIIVHFYYYTTRPVLSAKGDQ